MIFLNGVKLFIIYVDLLFFKLTTGQTVKIGIHPSKCIVKKLKLDKDRKSILARRAAGRVKEAKGEKITEAEVAAVSKAE